MSEKTPEGAPENTGSEEAKFTESEVNAKIEAAIKARFAKFEDYDAVKEKAGKADELQSTLDELTKTKEELEKQLNEFKTSKAKADLIASVAKKTGRSIEEISLLNGDDEETLTAAAEAIWKKYEPSKEGTPLGGKQTVDGWGELAHNLFSGE